MRPSVRLTSGGAARGADDWIERVRAACDIVEIVSQTVTLKRVGRNWVGLCPFHQEKTPSFSVHPERQFYHCFSCKVGGDVFKFVQEIEKLEFLEAAELLSRRAGIPIPERRAGERGTRGPLLDALEQAARLYEQWLGDPELGASARDYLAGRGLERDVVRAFRLGLAPPGWEHVSERLRPRFGEQVLVQAGLAARREGTRGGIYDRFRGRLMVPLVGAGGQVVGFGARALGAADQPKYLNSPETPVYRKGSFLYGLDQARRHLEPEGEAVVVEGYFDAIALHQAGVRNTVATSGTALTAEQAKQLRRLVARVALTYDGDRAGQEAMMRSLGILIAEGLDVVVVDLPAGQDPDSVVRERGIEGWKEARREARDPIEFIQRHVLEAGGARDAREQAVQAVVRLAVEVADPVRLKLLFERAERVFGVPESVMSRAAALRRSGQREAPAIQHATRERMQHERYLERQLLQALLVAPELRPLARGTIELEDFQDPACAALARTVLAEDDTAPEDEAAAALARELMSTAAESVEWGRIVEADVRRLVQRRLKRQYKAAQRRIEELQRRGLAEDPETLRLMRESDELFHSISDMNR